jgi:hypothetical protein
MASASDTPNQTRAPLLQGEQICSSVLMRAGFPSDQECYLCGAYFQSNCFAEITTEIKTDGNNLCSVPAIPFV